MSIKLVKKAIKGNAKAFEALLIEHQDQLYRTAYLYVGNREDSLDIVQETAYKGFKAIHQLKEPSYFKTWLTRILINTAMEFNKKQAGIIFLEDREDLQKALTITPDSQLSDEHLDLLSAINHLKENYREVILLFYYHSLSIKEIADILALPQGTVKTNLARGRQQLKNELEKGGSDYERQTN